ncbi:lectin C-type domain protein [Ostertagia ostertagi]
MLPASSYAKVFTQRATWNEAEDICKTNGGRLASITSDEENEFIYNLAKAPLDTNKNSDDDYNEMLWIGGRQAGYPSNTAWTWSDERPFSYTNWDVGEPNNKGGNEQCLQVPALI